MSDNDDVLEVVRGAGVVRVDLHLASRGNHFMAEIAELYRGGFASLGLPTEILLDSVPANDASRLAIVVAPHEYTAVFLNRIENRAATTREIASRVFVLNTEQPGTRWFERAVDFGLRSRGIFDINRQGVEAARRVGIRAVHAPLGYGPSLETMPEGGASPADEKPIDLVFLGHACARRFRFFSEYREVFHALDCRLIFLPVDRPRTADRADVYAGDRRNALLRSAKLVLNIHSSHRGYFEWHRALCAIANRAVFVSETSEQYDPLVVGKHFAMGSLSELASRCREIVDHSEERTRLAEAAYRCIRDRLPIEATCRRMLEHASAYTPTERVARRAVRRMSHRLSGAVRAANTVARRALTPSERASLADEAHDAANRLAATEKPFRIAFQLMHCGRIAKHRLFRRAAMARMHERRTALLQRLSQQASSNEAPGVITNNGAFATAADPAVSVVITLYNYRDHIIECLESVANSAALVSGGVEVVVVNDASTDDSSEQVKKWMEVARLPMRVVDKVRNTGLGDARNVGFRTARAPYVFVLDADNLVYPRGLRKLYDAIRSTDIAAVYGILARFDGASGAGRGLLSALGWDLDRIVAGPYIDAMAMFNRRQILELGGYTADLVRFGWFGWEDYDLWLTLADRSCEVRLVPEIVAGYRVHPGSMISETNYYAPRLAAFFRQKFAGLVERAEPGRSQFGAPIPRGTWS